MERISISEQFTRIAEADERRSRRWRRSTFGVLGTLTVIIALGVMAAKTLFDEHGSGVENAIQINESQLAVRASAVHPQAEAIGIIMPTASNSPLTTSDAPAKASDLNPIPSTAKRTPVKVALPEPTAARNPVGIEVSLAKYIATGYRVKQARAEEIVVDAVIVGKRLNIDPLLILAVVAIESRFDPGAQSSVGAQGLMQVHTQVHADKFSDAKQDGAAFSPLANIEAGSKILKGYIDRTGTVANALKWYVGASRLPGDGGYGKKVLIERSRMILAAKGRVDHARKILITNGFGPDYWASVKAKKLGFDVFERLNAQYGKLNQKSATKPESEKTVG